MKTCLKADRINASNATGDTTERRMTKAESEKKGSVFSTQKECQRRVDDYFSKHLLESGEVADIESLADYLGTTRDEIMAMMNDKRFGKTLRLARNKIAKIKKQLAFGGKIPAAVLSFDLKNNPEYLDTLMNLPDARRKAMLYGVNLISKRGKANI